MKRLSPLSRSLSTSFVTLLIAFGPSPGRSSAQDPDDAIKKKAVAPSQATKKDDESAVRLEEMKQIAHAFKFVTVDGTTRAPAELVPDPLHRWTDPTRPLSGGALWVWKSGGRPVAVLGIELYAAWSLEFVSLSTGLVEAQDGQLRWRPQRAGVEYSEIRGAPVPADDQPKRMRQMRDIVKRISASEFYDNKHYSLRLLPHPIDRYTDPASGVVDGAIFICANGTNPELLLLVEARRMGTGTPAWSYAAAPLSRAEVSLKLDGKDIWRSPTKEQTTPEEPYFDILKGRGLRIPRSVTPQNEQQ
jgi:hypothetical protein